MLEVIWHARGGQGAFTAARALGAAASLRPGAHALAFPTFGPERRGAPMRAYTKIADRPIGDRSASHRAAIVVYLDDTLFGDGWEEELAEGGVVLLNSRAPHSDARVLTLDASGLAAGILGRPIPNTAFLGAIAAVSDAVSLEDACEGVRATMTAKLHERNIEVVKSAYGLFKGVSNAREGSEAMAEEPRSRDDRSAKSRNPGSSPVALDVGSEAQAGRIIPRLREFEARPEDFARSTCFEGGFLVSKNAGWRSERPVIDQEACTLCLNCYMMCPDGTIYKVYDGGDRPTAIAIDYDFCKGCGICARTCPADCIAMVSEDCQDERNGAVRGFGIPSNGHLETKDSPVPSPADGEDAKNVKEAVQ